MATRSVLQESFERQSQDPLLPLWVRIGLHWGRPAARGDDLVDHDINVTARIVDVAGPREVLVSEALHAQVAGSTSELRFDELGPVVMKGVPEPVRLTVPIRRASVWRPDSARLTLPAAR